MPALKNRYKIISQLNIPRNIKEHKYLFKKQFKSALSSPQ